MNGRNVCDWSRWWPPPMNAIAFAAILSRRHTASMPFGAHLMESHYCRTHTHRALIEPSVVTVCVRERFAVDDVYALSGFKNMQRIVVGYSVYTCYEIHFPFFAAIECTIDSPVTTTSTTIIQYVEIMRARQKSRDLDESHSVDSTRNSRSLPRYFLLLFVGYRNTAKLVRIHFVGEFPDNSIYLKKLREWARGELYRATA